MNIVNCSSDVSDVEPDTSRQASRQDAIFYINISFEFGTEFDHVTPDVQGFKVKCQKSRSQRENIVWLPNYRCLLGNRGDQSNGYVRILIRISQLAVYAHV